MRRRDALVVVGAGAVALAVPRLLRRSGDDFTFDSIPGQPALRRLAQGPVTTAPPVFAGLRTPQEAAADAALPADLCPLLFEDRDWQTGLPVQVFSDYFCPYCGSFERRVQALADSGAPIRPVYRDLPLLGERSRELARVALAAEQQGKRESVRSELMQRGLRPGSAGIAALAGRHGLDLARLKAKMESEAVRRAVEQSLALGRGLGIPGTPGALVGRTLVIGAMADDRLEALIALERAAPFPGCA